MRHLPHHSFLSCPETARSALPGPLRLPAYPFPDSSLAGFSALYTCCYLSQAKELLLFGPSSLTTMASADFSTFSHASLHGLDFSVPLRSPRISPLTFVPSICRIYTSGFGQYWTSLCVANSSALNMPSMRFLFVRPGFCYGLLSDSTSRWTPLPFANSSYLYR